MQFNTYDELFSYIQLIPGYIPSFKSTNISTFEIFDGNKNESRIYKYFQSVDISGNFKERDCIIRKVFDENDNVIEWHLNLLLTSETPDGDPKIVMTYSGPDKYYPWVESIDGRINRDGSDAVPVNINLTECESSGAVYFKKIFSLHITQKIGLQNVLACWKRCNEGDFANIFVDAPMFDENWNVTGWVVAAQFGSRIVFFGDNEPGTWYPPNTSPAMGWIPQYCRIRVDFYKKAVNDSWLENEPGPYIDVDIFGQRER